VIKLLAKPQLALSCKVALSCKALFRVPQVVSLRTSGGCAATLARVVVRVEVCSMGGRGDSGGGLPSLWNQLITSAPKVMLETLTAEALRKLFLLPVSLPHLS